MIIEESYNQLEHEEKRLLAKSAGRSISEVPKAVIPLYRVMPYEILGQNDMKYPVNEEAFFAALCIRCIFEKTDGETIRPELLIKKALNSPLLGSAEGFERRISALMGNTEQNYFIMKLAKIMSYAQTLTSGMIPDCDQIYRDICLIDSSEKFVQRRWAKAIYSNSES